MIKQKKSIICVITALLIVCLSVSVGATEQLSCIYSTHSATTGTWYSGYDDSDFYSMTTSYPEVYGGDVGMYFYTGSVGMPKSYIKSELRFISFELKENDPGDDENELVSSYTGQFGVADTGLYQPILYQVDYVNSDCIENNSTVELYYRMYVTGLGGDTSRNIPGGIVNFRFWIEK